jgi:hypothetical protein
MSKWYFKELQPGDTTRDPIQGEFFATEAISNTAAALAREANQHTMNAGRDGEKNRVRIYLSAPATRPPRPRRWPPT